ncbi:hypothetical protein Agabi119p4_7861 [Agaricus bisporus var. burnettii]|uniref:DUF6533 domain-containing protein n=1 Tax=Agaricus bisporus var. burnettii TaxID=192524 RepID=A0A8H7EZA9_AGABI|nr:hypothetical protein Agabi119p4_7861 [Agaricus bisporus var. burnettii]
MPISTEVNSFDVAYEATRTTSYSYAAAIAVLVYDAFLLFGEEVKYIYSGPFTSIKALYVLIRHLAVFDSILFLYVYQRSAVPPSVYTVTWITGFARQVAYTCVIKTLFVLRLRALYGKNNMKVTILLGIAMTIEVIAAVFIFLLVSISIQVHGVLVVPFPGCIVAFSPRVASITQYGTVALWASKVFSNSVEVALTVTKLYQSLMNSNHTLLTSFERMRYWRPILYVFYRDGTLFFIPLFTCLAYSNRFALWKRRRRGHYGFPSYIARAVLASS